ncbi:MAG: 4Fe-4S dicluster domain-containing protein [Clostridiales bacterium]|nr:4Fe-4S dicluster domain-containing protein [Clostridiales bacterium]
MAFKGIVKFDEDRCKGCELCASACPKKIIGMSGHVNSMGYHPAGVDKMDECIACASCALMCPDGAIKVFKEN